MAQENERTKTPRERLDRLKKRLEHAMESSLGDTSLRAVVRGILDLLSDEL